MKYNVLGKTQLKVSEICFGSLTVGPLQKNLSTAEGSQVILEAFNRGINFIDTADLYETYPYIKKALEHRNRRDIIISTKSYAYDTKSAEKSFYKALKELNTDYIDLFMMHEQESEHTIRGHYEALEFYMKMKKQGYIRSIGLSTHHVSGVLGANKFSEIEVIHPIFNVNGLGIVDGEIFDMIEAIKDSKELGKGIFAMKPLGGGNLLNNINECFDFVVDNPLIDSIAIGMQSAAEVIDNVNRFSKVKTPKKILDKINNTKKQLHIASWCTGCGACIKRCQQNALTLTNNKVTVNNKQCILCGYCSTVCPDFCIKIV